MIKLLDTIKLMLLLTLMVGCQSQKTTTTKAPRSGSSSKLNDRAEINLKRNFLNGNKEKLLGNFDLSSNYFSKCLKIDPNHSASMFELANIYEYQGNDALALSMSKKAAELNPQNQWYQILLASLYQKHGKFNHSAKIYETLSKEYPYKIEYYYEWASSLEFVGDLKDAVEVYDKIENQIGISEDLSVRKERLHIKLGNTPKAIEEIKKLIKSTPGEARYYGMLAELYQMQGKGEDALQTYNELLEIDPDNPYIHLSLSDYYKENGEMIKAQKEHQFAFQNPDLDIDTKVHILLSYYTISEKDKGIREFCFSLCETLAKAHPEEAKTWAIYGDFLYRESKRLTEARDAYRKAVEYDKDNFVIWNQLLIIESDLREFNAMMEESKEAIELFPSQPAFYLYNGIANIQKKNYAEAIEVLNDGKSLVVDNKLLLGQFYANLGDAYYKNNEYPLSDEAYINSLEIEPHNTYVLNNYSYYLSLRKDKIEEAAKMSKLCNELEPNSPSYQDTYGWILFQMRKYEDAKKWIEKAINSGGAENAVILEHYGDLLYKLEDRQGGIKYWNKAKAVGQGSELLDRKISDQQYYE